MDWAALVLTLAGIWLVGSKKRSGFLAGMAGNVVWIGWALLCSGTLPLVLTNVVIFALNLRAWLLWKTDEHQESS